jgi:hypothetical protein
VPAVAATAVGMQFMLTFVQAGDTSKIDHRPIVDTRRARSMSLKPGIAPAGTARASRPSRRPAIQWLPVHR